MKKTTLSVAGLCIALAGPVGPAHADDHVYVVENGAAIRLHGLTFNGTAFAREDLNPSLPQLFLSGGSEASGVAATDRFLLSGTSSLSIGLNAFDPLNGIELPRVGTAINGAKPVMSADQQFAFLVGSATNGSVVLSVIDVRPSSPTFLKEIAAPTLAVAGAISAAGITLGPTGQFLYVATYFNRPSTDTAMHIAVVDVSAPAAPVVQSTFSVPQPVGAPWPATLVNSNAGIVSLGAFTVGGKTLLFAARFYLYIMEIQSDGGLRTIAPGVASAARINSFYCSTPCSGGSMRAPKHAFAADTPSGPRAFVTTDRAVGPSGPQIEELLVIDLAGMTASAASDDAGVYSGITPRVRRIEVLQTSGTADNDSLAAGPGGSLFVLSPGGPGTESPTIAALNLAALSDTSGGLAAAVSPVRECISEPGNATCTGPVGDSYSGQTFSIRAAAFSSPPAPTISRLLVDGSPTPILVNDQGRSLTIEGSGLGDIKHVFVGLDRLCVNDPAACPSSVVADDHVTALTEPLLPSSNRPVVVVDGSGAVAVSNRLTVANSPAFFPAHVVYGLAYGENAVHRFQSATSTRVSGSFPTLSAPSRGSVSSDGRWLYSSAFRAGRVAVHSIVADPDRGYDWDQEITGGGLFVGGFPQSHALDDQPGRSRKRLYVTSMPGSIATIDVGVVPPALVDIDGNAGTTDDNDFNPATTTDPPLPPGISKISVIYDAVAGGTETRTALPAYSDNRGLSVSSDGNWLYATRNANPHLVAINVSDDVVTSVDRTFISLNPGAPGGPIPAGGPAAPGVGRADGMVIVGSRLYFASSTENKIRIFNMAGAVLAQASPVAEISLPGPLPSTRNLAALPDGRFLYATSRRGAKVDVIDLATDTWVASIPTGLFTEGVSPSPDSQFVYVGSGEKDVMWTIDARPGSATLHQRIASFGGGAQLGWVIAAPGVVTPVGSSVPVQPSPKVDLTFDSVLAAGNTAVTSANVTPLTVPAGFSILNVQNPVYYEVKTTASFTGLIRVCLSYTDEEVQGVDESTLRFMHEEAGVLTDRTIAPPHTDPSLNRICGEVSSFSALSIAVAPDLEPPQVTCDASDGLWHGDNVALQCGVADQGSGLAAGTNSTFALTTSVPAGMETAHAATDTRLVCDRAGNCATAGPVGDNRVDRKAPTVNLVSPTTGPYTVGQVLAAAYSCDDGGSGVASCSGNVASGAPLSTEVVGFRAFSVVGTDALGNSASASVQYSVKYGICPLYDSQKVHKAGSTIPIKVQLCDAFGSNRSSPAAGVAATGVFLITTNATGVLDDAGNANPDFNFRYSNGAYVFNLKTTGFAAGTYGLNFVAEGDPTVHTVGFRIR